MAKRKFRLTSSDKKILHDFNYNEAQCQQIEDAVCKGSFRYASAEISWMEARRILGVEDFIRGIATAAFHKAVTMESRNGSVVYIDFKNI